MKKAMLFITLALLLLLVPSASAQTLTLPDNLTDIEEEAFMGDESIGRVILPDGIRTIRSKAFASSSVYEIYLPENLTYIAPDAFDKCGEVVGYGPSNTYAFIYFMAHNLPFVTEGILYESLGNGTCAVCGYEGTGTDVFIPSVSIDGETVVAVSDRAFMNNIAITRVRLPETVTTVGEEAFCGCTNLKQLNFPASVTFIGEDAVLDADKLSRLTAEGEYATDWCMKNWVYTFDDTKFKYRAMLDGTASVIEYIGAETDVVVPATAEGYEITSVASNAFGRNNNVVFVTFSEGIASLGEYIFINSQSLTTVVLPESLKTMGTGAFYYCYRIESINIPRQLESIGESAFECCSGIPELDLPGTLMTIPVKAFSGCSNLVSLKVSEGTTKIERSAFEKCTMLETLELPASVQEIGENVVYECNNLVNVNCPSGSYAEQWAIENGLIRFVEGDIVYQVLDNSSVRAISYRGDASSVTIPSPVRGYTVTEIGREAFKLKRTINYLVISEGVVTIDEAAFSSLQYLYTLKLPSTLTSIGKRAFNDCFSIEEVELPERLEYIGEEAFSECSGLKSIAIPDTVTAVDRKAFIDCWDLEEVYIGTQVETIGECAFQNDSEIKTLNLPESLTEVGEYAFDGCTSLENVTVPDNRESYAYQYALYNGLLRVLENGFVASIAPDGTATLTKYKGTAETITLPAQMQDYPVVAVGENAYYSVYSNETLKKLIVPEGITVIGDSAFSWCVALREVVLPDGIASIGREAFFQCKELESINLPDSIENIGLYAFKWDDKLVVQVNEGTYAYEYCVRNDLYKLFSDDVVYTLKPDGSVMVHSARPNVSELTIPDTFNSHAVKAIRERAFADNVILQTVEIPDSVTLIGKEAFKKATSLQEVTLPTNLTLLDSYTFQDCENLRKIEIPASVTKIDENAFAGCKAMGEVIFKTGSQLATLGYGAFSGCTQLTSITLPNSLTDIGYYTFRGCSSLNEVTLSNGMTHINNGDFAECVSLKALTIPPSVISIPDIAEVYYNPFYHVPSDLVVTAETDSYAAQWAARNGLTLRAY